ncbi:MAG: hypothetical protein WC803_10015 [Sphingomonas sp.]|jgi:hypothetical protein
MTHEEKAKLAAAGKMAFGAFRMGGAIATATGHGLLGGALKQRHMMHLAMRFGKAGFDGGRKMFSEGLAEWKGASPFEAPVVPPKASDPTPGQ